MTKKNILPCVEVLDLLARLRTHPSVAMTHYFELRRLAFHGALPLQLIQRALELEIDLEAVLE